MFMKLNQTQLKNKLDFIENYIGNKNAATGSLFDSNANVEQKNIATLEGEINKDINIQINRYIMFKEITKIFGEDLANEYIRQIEKHEIYVHDETSLKPYCVAISLYPFLNYGLQALGGESKAPKHLSSFNGGFINLMFAVASQFAGAVAAVEYLMFFDYFARKEYGDNYLETNKNLIIQELQQVVYALNQPAAARGYQSVFWNISVFDKDYFNGLFEGFVFPDMTKPSWESLEKLQYFFLNWFNKERIKAVLTFPVVTVAMLSNNKEPKNKNFAKNISKEMSEGNTFFIYMSDNVDSLSSCCRLRNELQDNTFSYSLGAGGVMSGSINVITLNMNRLYQDERDLKTEIEKIHKYQFAYHSLVKKFLDRKMLPVYDAGFIELKKQFLTIGLNGLLEGAEYLGYEATNNTKYKSFLASQLKIIYDANKEAKNKYGLLYNTELVPAENVAGKNFEWDKKDGYFVPRESYNSYFYKVEDESSNVIDKFILHGKEVIQFLDGGSALHLNLEEYLTEDQFYNLLCIAAKTGCNYFTTNVKITICNECNTIDKNTLQKCPKCGSKNIDYATRIIGYLKRISSWSEKRQKESSLRYYSKEEK